MHCETSIPCGTALLGLALLGVVSAPPLLVAVVAAAVHRNRTGEGFFRSLLAWWAAGTSVFAGLVCLAGAAYVLVLATHSGLLSGPATALPKAHVAAAARGLRAGASP